MCCFLDEAGESQCIDRKEIAKQNNVKGQFSLEGEEENWEDSPGRESFSTLKSNNVRA